MIEIAICDDEKTITSEIEDRLNLLSKKMAISIKVDVFFDGVTLTNYISAQNPQYDIIYIDIEMEKENGVEAARKIRQFDKNVLLIYVTNHESFAKEVFEVSAFRFLTKPISDFLFEKYFINAIDEIRQAPYFFQFQYNKVHYKLILGEIVYFQSDKRVTYIICLDGMQKCYEKLNSIEQRLEQSDVHFFRTHQSFLVNPKYVEIYMYDAMQLKDGTILSISENRRKKVSELYCKIKGDSIIV